jgi:hypothetical protein
MEPSILKAFKVLYGRKECSRIVRPSDTGTRKAQYESSRKSGRPNESERHVDSFINSVRNESPVESYSCSPPDASQI